MNIDELREHIGFYKENEDDIGISVYVLLKNDDSFRPKKLDIESDALPELKTMFLSSMNRSILSQEDLTLLNLSSSDERTSAIYLYDIEVPEELASMDMVLATDEHHTFNLAEDNLSDVKAFLIEIGNNENQVVLYKTLASINIFGRSSFFLKKSDERFKKIDEDFFRINDGFQLIKVNNRLIVMDLKTLERFFGFHDVIIREALSGIEAIETMNILENPETLRELAEDIKYARRYTKVSRSSPVLRAGIPNNEIIDFCRIHPALTNKIRFNDDSTKLQLDTQVSKDLFIKLLMDDFLTSELTSYHYTSEAKDTADE